MHKSVSNCYSNPKIVSLYQDKKDYGLWKSEEFLISKYFKKYKPILDLGAGTGRTTFALNKLGYGTIAFDLSYDMVKEVPKSIVANAAKLPFKDKSFENILFSYNGICHLEPADNIMMFKEIKRILQKGGIFIFSFQPKHWYQFSKLNWVFHSGSFQNFQCRFYKLSKNELKNFIEKENLLVIEEGDKSKFENDNDQNYPESYFFAVKKI